jgi:hypothetical protein
MGEELHEMLNEQKKAVLALINGGGKNGLIIAKGALQLLLPLWSGYGYRSNYDSLMNMVFEREASNND